jgi:uncharacterized protein (TIGR00251 family)
MSALAVTERNGSIRFSVHVKPRSSRSRVEGVREDGALIVALKAPPVDGAANAELIKVLASSLGVKKKAVSIASGQNGRRKVIDVAGLSTADAGMLEGG